MYDPMQPGQSIIPMVVFNPQDQIMENHQQQTEETTNNCWKECNDRFCNQQTYCNTCWLSSTGLIIYGSLRPDLIIFAMGSYFFNFPSLFLL